MKNYLRLSAFLLITVIATSSCSKIILTEESPIAGTWILSNAAHKDAYGWYNVTTGVENGTFYFYSNGTARYTEGHITMNGTWSVRNASGGYYDEYGSYYSDAHQSLQVNLSDYYGDNTINMYFDNVRFRSNTFVATNYKNNYIEKYTFSRY